MFQHTAARRRLAAVCFVCRCLTVVSTHSRPKAAGFKLPFTSICFKFQHTAARRRLGHRQTVRRHTAGFNTQPPEGGWLWTGSRYHRGSSFNTQPPEGGWLGIDVYYHDAIVSTHSRPKAAGPSIDANPTPFVVSTHSRPKAAGLESLDPFH